MQPEIAEQVKRFNERVELYKLARYAPGNYQCRCMTCGRHFDGDKLASRCFDCASVLVQKNS
jgi:predicted Zn-ribbon and HTH transcriptional regulator